MADVITYAKAASTVIRNGSMITSADKLGNVHIVVPNVEHNQVAPQSGILDTRFDDLTTYTA